MADEPEEPIEETIPPEDLDEPTGNEEVPEEEQPVQEPEVPEEKPEDETDPEVNIQALGDEEPPVDDDPEPEPSEPVLINGKPVFDLSVDSVATEFNIPETWALELIRRYFGSPPGLQLFTQEDRPGFKVNVVEKGVGTRGLPPIYNGKNQVTFTSHLVGADAAKVLADIKKQQPHLIDLAPWVLEPQ